MKTTEKQIVGALRVWWIPQVPMNPFLASVANSDEAKLLLKTLADYDIFQFENNVKPDYSNAGGLEQFDGEEWTEWENEHGECIDDVMNEEEAGGAR